MFQNRFLVKAEKTYPIKVINKKPPGGIRIGLKAHSLNIFGSSNRGFFLAHRDHELTNFDHLSGVQVVFVRKIRIKGN